MSEQVKKLGEATGQLVVDENTPAQIKTLNDISQSLTEAGLQKYLEQVAGIIEWYNKAQLAVNADKSTATDVDSVLVPVTSAKTEVSPEQLTQQYQTLKASLMTGTKDLMPTDKVCYQPHHYAHFA